MQQHCSNLDFKKDESNYYQLNAVETLILDSFFNLFGNIFALNSRQPLESQFALESSLGTVVQSSAQRLKNRNTKSAPLTESISLPEFLTRIEADILDGWPSMSSPSTLLIGINIVLSFAHYAERPLDSCGISYNSALKTETVEAVRSVSFFHPIVNPRNKIQSTSSEFKNNETDLGNKISLDLQHIDATQLDVENVEAEHMLVSEKVSSPTIKTDSSTHSSTSHSISDGESLPNSFEDPYDIQDNQPFALMSFTRSTQRLLLGLTAYTLSSSLTASSIDLDSIKKSFQIGASDASDSIYETLTNHLRLILSRLQFTLQCCSLIFATPLIKHPPQSLNVVENLLPNQSTSTSDGNYHNDVKKTL